jgi:hypothetical protein
MTGQPTFPEPPAVADEATTLVGSLERQRATFAWKVADLDRERLSRRIGDSALSLGSLLKHLAYMEDLNFTRELGGDGLPRPWADVDPEIRSEWAFRSADDTAEDLYGWWRDAVERSRRAIRTALAGADPGVTYRSASGHELTVRRLLVDMIEEYGRHTGHADLIRESIDGRVGEDPPGRPEAFAFRA